MLNNILLAIFSLLMILNAIALVRHYMLMRVMIISLNSFVEQQRWFNEFIEQQRQDKQSSLAPE